MDEKRTQSRTKEKAPILTPKVLITSNEKKQTKHYLTKETFPKSLDANKKFCSRGHLKCCIAHSSVIPVNKN